MTGIRKILSKVTTRLSVILGLCFVVIGGLLMWWSGTSEWKSNGQVQAFLGLAVIGMLLILTPGAGISRSTPSLYVTCHVICRRRTAMDQLEGKTALVTGGTSGSSSPPDPSSGNLRAVTSTRVSNEPTALL